MFPRRYFPGTYFSPRLNPMGWGQGGAAPNSWWPTGYDADNPYMRLWAQDANGFWVERSFTTDKICVEKIAWGYGRPASCEFTIYQAQHTIPIPAGAGIVLVDESYGYYGTPVFEGFCEAPIPVGSNELKYVAYDATRRASKECWVMSRPYVTDIVQGLREGTGAVPHCVFNVKETDQDEEFAYARDNDATMQTIAQTLLSDCNEYLKTILAAPPPQIGGNPYETTDFDAMTHKPQTKITFSSETIRGALERFLQFNPRYRLKFVYGHDSRKWRVYDTKAAPAVTLTLNDPTADKQVLTLNLYRLTDRRYSAVKIYGPQKLVIYDAYVSTATLTEGWTAPQEGQFLTLGPNGSTALIGDTGKVWQVTDATKRALATRLPSDGLVPKEYSFGTALEVTRLPTLVVTYDDGDTWEVVPNTTMDRNLGKVIAPNRVYRYDETSDLYSVPDDARFLMAYYDTPLSVRYPLSGYAGTLYTVAGIGIEQKIYDPGLAVGWENGTPVAEATRTAQYQLLAQRLHEAISDISYAGGFTLAAVDYDWLHLNKRVHLAAVDKDGAPLTTGWEAIGAIVTDGEIDYRTKITTVTLASDQLEFSQLDPEAIKEDLQISAEQYRVITPMGLKVTYNGADMSGYFTPGADHNTANYHRDDSSSQQYGVDPETGRPLSEGMF